MNLFPPQPAWFEQALCAQTGPDDYMWFGPQGMPPVTARKLCARCPVADLCLEYAIENHEQGIWAGTTERQRREMRKDGAA